MWQNFVKGTWTHLVTNSKFVTVRMKTYLETSNEELLIVYKIVRNNFLWSNKFFDKEVTSHYNIWIRERFQVWSFSQASECTQLCVMRVFFLSLLLCNFDDQLSPKLHRFVILRTCWDTPSKNTSLRQLPIMSSAFKLCIQ